MKILSALAGLFTRNWGLKLLALALAIVIYHSLKQSSTIKTATDTSSIINTEKNVHTEKNKDSKYSDQSLFPKR